LHGRLLLASILIEGAPEPQPRRGFRLPNSSVDSAAERRLRQQAAVGPALGSPPQTTRALVDGAVLESARHLKGRPGSAGSGSHTQRRASRGPPRLARKLRKIPGDRTMVVRLAARSRCVWPLL
jgi:hypothetical protein